MFRLIIILFVLTFNVSYNDLEYNYKYPDTFIDVNKSIQKVPSELSAYSAYLSPELI